MWEDDPNVDYSAFCKELYFFYGSLIDGCSELFSLKLTVKIVVRRTRSVT